MEERKQTGSTSYYRKSKAHFLPLLNALLEDPLLADVPKDRPTLRHVDNLISVELGNAMRLSIVKMDGSVFDVTVQNTATVKDLKAEVQEKITESEQAQLGHRHLSWKYVWGNFCLCYGNEKLLEEGVLLRDFGIRSNDQIKFEHHLVSREAGRHSRAKRRRFFHGLRKD